MMKTKSTDSLNERCGESTFVEGHFQPVHTQLFHGTFIISQKKQ